jgi:hypothetical protein
MFEGKHSKILVSRHAAAITRVCRVHERGFPLRDLPQLCKLFRFAYDQVAAGKAKEFEEALCAVMRCELARSFWQLSATPSSPTVPRLP